MINHTRPIQHKWVKLTNKTRKCSVCGLEQHWGITGGQPYWLPRKRCPVGEKK